MHMAECAKACTVSVRIEPLGEVVYPLPGERLMRAAQRAGLYWPTLCNGALLCGACHVRVVVASEPLAPPSALELQVLKLVPVHKQGPSVRLACQLVPKGEMTVERAGVARRDQSDEL